MKTKSYEQGRYGEDMADLYLRDRGYQIIDRNVRLLRCEVDVVAQLNDVIIFVEVKARSNESFGKGFEHVTPQKQKRLIRFAQLYVNQHKLQNLLMRFDVISITLDPVSGKARKIEHYANAFGW